MTETRNARRAPISYFVDRRERPSLEDFRRILGRVCVSWGDLESMLTESFGLRARVHYMYGERYGWALRFERYGRLVVAMYPNRGRLSVQIILNRAQVNAALAMSLPAHVSGALEVAKDYPEGRWLFVPVKSRTDARGLQPILALKMPVPDATRVKTLKRRSP